MWQQKEENGFEDIWDYERFDTHYFSAYSVWFTNSPLHDTLWCLNLYWTGCLTEAEELWVHVFTFVIMKILINSTIKIHFPKMSILCVAFCLSDLIFCRSFCRKTMEFQCLRPLKKRVIYRKLPSTTFQVHSRDTIQFFKLLIRGFNTTPALQYTQETSWS